MSRIGVVSDFDIDFTPIFFFLKKIDVKIGVKIENREHPNAFRRAVPMTGKLDRMLCYNTGWWPSRPNPAWPEPDV